MKNPEELSSEGIEVYMSGFWKSLGDDLKNLWHGFFPRSDESSAKGQSTVLDQSVAEAEEQSLNELSGYDLYSKLQEDALEREKELLEYQNSFNAHQAELNAQRNADQATIAFERQKELATSSYQYATQSMREAGLNPILAYTQGGVSYPSVNSASSTAASSASAKLDVSILSDLIKGQQANNAQVTSAIMNMIGQITNGIGSIIGSVARIK